MRRKKREGNVFNPGVYKLMHKRISTFKHSDKDFDEAMDAVVDYLDSCGYYMPKPKYKYRPDLGANETWMFLDGEVVPIEGTDRFTYRNVYNPIFNQEI